MGGIKRHRVGSSVRGGGQESKQMNRNSIATTNKKMGTTREDRKQQLEQEIATLSQRVIDEAPPPSRSSSSSNSSNGNIVFKNVDTVVTSFVSLPLSSATQRGLLDSQFTTMTAIQAAVIPHALVGRDILGAARTGSGKTLAFLIPILERLFREQFTPSDGPGAVVLSPTRELAIQIFKVLQQVGKYHTSISVGLLIGGKKDFYVEQSHICTTNIIIATPGRLLQHLEQTPQLDMTELRVLVLDEADRILDMGFRNQLVRILDYLPNSNNNNSNDQQQRQTMLFSATQTRDVKSLATLSLRESPEYIGVHDTEKTETPELLQQSYVIVPVEHKLNAIYSFIKTHLQCKSIIFMSTCAQVRHAHDLFCHLRPGVPIMALHGKLSQERRTQIYFDIMDRSSAVLFATDLAARGLDFPNIDWVVQVDAPEDAAMYIHRAGRTARYRSTGKSLLMVTPEEERRGLIDLVLQGGSSNSNSSTKEGGKTKHGQKVPIKKLGINPAKATIVTDRAASIVASNVPLNTLAKKAFQSYIRSITLMPHQTIFNVQDLDLDEYAKSLGLASTPNLRFLEKAAANRTEFRDNKNVNKKLQRLKEQIKAEKLQKRIAKLGGKVPQEFPDSVDDTNRALVDDESDDELLVAKGKEEKDTTNDDIEDLPDMNDQHLASKRQHPKKIRVDSTAGLSKNHIVFNEEGEVDDLTSLMKPTKPAESLPQDKHVLEQATVSYVDQVRERLSKTKEQDRAEQKERIRQKHKKQRLADKGDRLDETEEAPRAVLGSNNLDCTESDSSQDNDEDDDTSSADVDESSSDSSDEDDEAIDLKKQEEMALALIRRSK